MVRLNLLRINWQGQAARKTCTPSGPLGAASGSSVSAAGASAKVSGIRPIPPPRIPPPPLPRIGRRSGTATTSGSAADDGSSPARPDRRQPPPIKPRRAIASTAAPAPAPPAVVVASQPPAPSAATIAPAVASSGAVETMIDGPASPSAGPAPSPTIHQTAIRLSPRLEMRLALNHDILGEEDLISCEHGTINLESILGRDLSSYQRCTGRELMQPPQQPPPPAHRPVHTNRIAPSDAPSSLASRRTVVGFGAGQKNSKMDTPTPNRRKQSPSTWSSSACAAAGEQARAASRSAVICDKNKNKFFDFYFSTIFSVASTPGRAAMEKKLSDLERLARAEKKQVKSMTHPADHPSIGHGQLETMARNASRGASKSRGL